MLHGDPHVLLAGGPAVALERRAAALCALAALEAGCTRERAARWLWPDSDDPRRNLRQQMLRFRKGLGVALLAEGDVLALAADVRLAAADPAAPLLGTLKFDDSPEFDAWLAARRSSQHAGHTARLRERIAQAEAAGALDAALAAAQELLAADPDGEAAHREVMRLHYLRGDSAAGLAVHDRLVRHLAHVHHARPHAETEVVARALRESAAPLPAAPRATPPTVQRPPRLIGRARELAAVHDGWAAGAVVLLLGEAGMGKSRLIAEIARVRRLALVQGRPGDAGIPYATLARLLREALPRAGQNIAADQRRELARVLPELAPAFPLPADGRRLVLQNAVRQVLAGASLEAVAVDDLHFADDASIDMLLALAGDAGPGGPRWLFARRPAEGGAAAAALHDTLQEAGSLRSVPLQPLDKVAIADLIDSLGLHGVDGSALAAQLVRQTGGNPLFALETLKLALASGSLREGSLPQPASVGALIERRLARVSEPALGVARVAAIAGVDFNILLAEAVMKRSAVELASAWRELEDAQVLRGDDFAHDLVYDAVLRTIPTAIARRLHAQCAEFLAARDGEPARVAEHWLAGGEMAKAGAAFIAAARRAQLAMREEDEVALLLRAAQAFEAADMPDERFSALRDRARGLVTLDISRRGVDAARELIAIAANDRQRLQAQPHYVGALVESGRHEQAIEVGSAALALALRTAEHDPAVRLACHVASALSHRGRVDEALATLLPLRAWVQSQPDQGLAMLWHGDVASRLGSLGRFDEAVATYDTAIAAARAGSLPEGEARLMMNCAITLRESGQFDRALALAQQSRARYSPADSDDNAGGMIGRLVVARDQAEGGCFEPALATLTDLLPRFEASGAAFWAQAVRMVLVRLWLDLGQYARAVPLLNDEPQDIPPWLRADRQLLQRELALATRGGPPIASLETTLALVEGDQRRRLSMQVRALRHLAPTEVLSRADDQDAPLRASGRKGVLLSLLTQVARAAREAAQPARAAQAAREVVALMEAGYAPDSMYRAEAWLAAQRALAAVGEQAAAAHALEQGRLWVRQHALPQVPAPFIDSFLNRNAVNAALLGATSR
jgi:DNA-binding SARP family transcriptional activator